MDDMHTVDYNPVHGIHIPGDSVGGNHILADTLVGGDIASHFFLLMQQQRIFLDIR